MFRLDGRNALVTGATGGIGEAIARKLHSMGANVMISGTREAKLDELSKSLGDRVFSCPCNLGDEDSSIAKLAAEAESKMGAVHILVNNAGLTRDNLFLRMKKQDWDDVISINLTATYLLTQKLLRKMMSERFGRIINITSVVGLTGNAGQANYSASKAGLTAMSKSLAQEVASRNITVNCIAPGFIETNMTDKLNDKQKEAILSAVPAKRMGQAEEISNLALFLASNEAGYITGETVNINGGMLMV